MNPIRAKTVRYIKLGRGGRWEAASLERAEVQFGHGRVPHEMARGGDREAMKQHLTNQGRGSQAAADDVRELLDFYSLGADCLWVTFARDHLWWTFANPEVIWVGGDGGHHGERFRKAIGGWRNTDIAGRPIRIDTLSTKLTKVASYRRTICAVEAEEYLLRRINGVIEPIVAEAANARAALLHVTARAIASLHWADFETLVDIVFARSGWHRASAVGGSQKTIDLALEQPTTGERAMVQVKSKANQSVLDRYVQEFDALGTYHRLFFVCHTPSSDLAAPDRRDVHVWADREFAATVLKSGLHDWVIEKVT
jgi:Restriction endonuclease